VQPFFSFFFLSVLEGRPPGETAAGAARSLATRGAAVRSPPTRRRAGIGDTGRTIYEGGPSMAADEGVDRAGSPGRRGRAAASKHSARATVHACIPTRQVRGPQLVRGPSRAALPPGPGTVCDPFGRLGGTEAPSNRRPRRNGRPEAGCSAPQNVLLARAKGSSAHPDAVERATIRGDGSLASTSSWGVARGPADPSQAWPYLQANGSRGRRWAETARLPPRWPTGVRGPRPTCRRVVALAWRRASGPADPSALRTRLPKQPAARPVLVP